MDADAEEEEQQEETKQRRDAYSASAALDISNELKVIVLMASVMEPH